MPLAGLTELVQVLLNVNSTLDCSNVYQLEDAIVNDAIQSVPSACDTAYVLGESSAETDSFDNSQLAEPYGRVVIIGEYTFEDLLLIKSGDDLALRLTTDSGDRTVTFTNWYLDEANEVSIFELPDGEEYIFANLRTHVALAQELTEQADEFTGSDQPDVIYGLGGNDTLMGNNRADTLIGGPGNDWLIGNTARLDQDGNPTTTIYADSSIDVYVYNTGDGNDVIYAGYSSASDNRDLLKFGPGITSTDITVTQSGNNVVLTLPDGGSVTVYSWFENANYRLGTIQFDGQDPIDATEFVEANLP